MKRAKKITKLVQYLAIMIFVLGGGALLVAYASGLRIDPETRKVVETGLIILDSKPRNATVTLDGKKHKENTPTRFDGLTPSSYTVSVSKQGFRAWTKIAEVEESLLTDLSYVLLMPNEVFPEIAVELASDTYALSSNGREIALISDAEGAAAVYRARAGETASAKLFVPPKDPAGRTTKIDDVQWSRRGDRLLVDALVGEIRTLYLITNSGELIGQITGISGSALSSEDEAIIAHNDSNSLFILSSKKELYRVPAQDPQSSTLIAQDASLIERFPDRTIFSSTQNGATSLFSLTGNRQDAEKIGDLPAIPAALSYSNFAGRKMYIALMPDEILVFDSSAGTRNIKVRASRLLASPNQKFLALIGDDAISVLDLERYRLSSFNFEKIGHVEWVSDGYHLIITSGKSIYLADFDGQNMHRIADYQSASPVEFSQDTKSFYFLDSRETLNITTNEKKTKSFLFSVSIEKSFR